MGDSSAIQIPIYTLSSDEQIGGRSSLLREKIGELRPRNWPCQFRQQTAFMPDRFIPTRRHRNIDAVNYNLMKVPPLDGNTMHVDPISQIEKLNTTWRKNLMKKAMDRANFIPGINDRRILKFHEPEKRQIIRDFTSQQYWLGGIWKSRARDKPLMNTFSTFELRRSRVNWVGSLDWGAQNLLAAVIERPISRTDVSIVAFNAAVINTDAISKSGQQVANLTDHVFAIKWNHAGDKIGVVTTASETRVYTLEKLCWSHKCPCSQFNIYCDLEIVGWSHADKEFIVYCNTGRISSYTSSGEIIQSRYPDNIENMIIIAITISPNDRYIACTGINNVRIYIWPSLEPYLEMAPISVTHRRPSTWHPWDPNVLCVGACKEESTLTVWNVHRQIRLGYKKAKDVRNIDEITWNKLSGELVVRWDCWYNNQYRSIVTILESLDRVVDIASKHDRTSCLVWNPDNTLLAMRKGNQVVIWNFFGNEREKWHESKEKENRRKKVDSLKRRRAIYTDPTKRLEHYIIH